MATGAQVIAERLYEAGCRHAFGIPGGEILTLMDALDSVGIEFILVKHENDSTETTESNKQLLQEEKKNVTNK